MMRRTLLVLAAFATVILVASPVAAQSRFGVRAGVSGDPDQFVFGGHFETQELLDDLTFRPNVEVGVGDHLTTVAINFEFAYWIPLDNQPWNLYVGGGPAVNIWSYDSGHPGHRNDNNVGGGFNVMLGIQHDRGLFTEVKVGAIDSPSVKWVVGYGFK